MSDPTDEIWSVVEPYLKEERIELDDVQLQGVGPNLRLKVTVDTAKGIDIDQVASVSRRLTRLIDTQGLITGPYTLEVSSPGLERRLNRTAHYSKSIGRDVRIKARDADGGSQTVRGILVAADPETVTIEVEGERIDMPVQDITHARTVYEMKPTPKPGGRR